MNFEEALNEYLEYAKNRHKKRKKRKETYTILKKRKFL